MSVDPALFRRAMGRFATGVTVVTTRDENGKPLGLTANAVCSVSLEPPLMLVCVGARSETHAGFRRSGLFGVSVLSEGQEELSRSFARPGGEKFSGVPVLAGESGVPLLRGALAHLECRVESSHLAGDHTIYIGEVLRLAIFEGRPLLYFGSSYHGLGGLAGGTP